MKKTKVVFTGKSSCFCLWNTGDVGYVDGYIVKNNCVYACVVTEKHIIPIELDDIEVISEE